MCGVCQASLAYRDDRAGTRIGVPKREKCTEAHENGWVAVEDAACLADQEYLLSSTYTMEKQDGMVEK